MTEPPPARRRLLPLVLLGLALLGGGGAWWARQRALDARAEAARAAFEPALQALTPAGAEAAWDIDESVRAMHEIEAATREVGDLPQWLARVSRLDTRRVKPEVLEARRALLEVLMDLYAAQVALEDQEALWEVSSSLVLLSTLSVVEVEGTLDPLSPSGAVSVDAAQAGRLVSEHIARQQARGRLTGQLREAEQALLAASLRWSQTWVALLEDWDRLCLLRDRAYLAAAAGDWAAAAEAADAAIALAPLEREAHLLRARVAIEGGEVDDPEGAAATRALLQGLLERHPGHSAPTLLLLGALEARVGDPRAARLHLEQAASLYPRQADALDDLLDPYRGRAWLRRSPDGGRILEAYQASMVGAGWYSPELQLARLHFAAGDVEGGRARVLGHFARRSKDGAWEALLADLDEAARLLGPDYRAIFPEDHWLELELSEAMFSSAWSVAVHNRSDRVLHNVKLVLALRFTDMFTDDFHTLKVGKTLATLPSLEVTDFGEVEVRVEHLGEAKTTDDVVLARAMLVADEAVVWVDADRFREALPPPAAGDPPDQAARVALAAGQAATLALRSGLLSDELDVALPRELQWLRPDFSLEVDGELHEARVTVAAGDEIRLGFEGLGRLTGSAPRDLVLRADTPYGALVLTWQVAPEGTVRLVDLAFEAG